MSFSRLSRRAGMAALIGLATAALLIPSVGADADTQPPSSSTPATVSTDVLPTTQIDGVVWSQVVVGTTVFAGGQFTTARPAGAATGAQTVTRSNFVAYDITTGALLPFAPSFNAQVRAVAVSPDQSTLYVGGQFTTVNGAARYRVAAFNIANGALTGFAPTINSSVYGLAATESKVYVVGTFTSVTGQTRTNAVALNSTTGAVLPFAVTPAGGTIRQVVVSPDRTKVVLGGNFTSMSGSNRPGYGLALVNGDSGAMLAMPVNSLIRDGGSDSAIMSLAGASDGFYGSGYRFTDSTGNLEGTFKADWNGNLTWIEDCHGDTYSVVPTTDVVYVAGHPHDCSTMGAFPNTSNPVVYHRGLSFTTAHTGTVSGRVSGYYDYRGQPAPSLLNWYPDLNAGTYTGQSQGPWSVAAGGNYVVYGGEFTTVNGKAQQGLVRFARASVAPNLDGPRLSGPDFNLSARSSGVFSRSVSVSWTSNWDRDNVRLTYKLVRNGVTVRTSTQDSTFWSRPTMSYSDSQVSRGQTYTYQVSATDPFGNAKTSDPVSVTVR
jgi:hypothetical protein